MTEEQIIQIVANLMAERDELHKQAIAEIYRRMDIQTEEIARQKQVIDGLRDKVFQLQTHGEAA